MGYNIIIIYPISIVEYLSMSVTLYIQAFFVVSNTHQETFLQVIVFKRIFFLDKYFVFGHGVGCGPGRFDSVFSGGSHPCQPLNEKKSINYGKNTTVYKKVLDKQIKYLRSEGESPSFQVSRLKVKFNQE